VEGPDGERDWVAYGTMTDDDAAAFARLAIDSNHQLLCHTNGDAAADQLLRVYEAARDASDNPNKMGLRPVMIHCQTARTDQYEKMAEIGMIPSIFSSHIWYWGDAHLRNFGPVRGGRVSACGDAARAGLPFTLHTDTPVLRPNLLEAAWCAVNRVTKAGAQLDEDQKVTPYQAMRAITFNGAYQYGEEDLKGTLEAGKLADLVVLDRNPLAVDPREIRDIKVLATIKEGEVIYRRDEA
ncbi:amidohydrolase, partial [Adlercreutzia muris]